MTRTAPDTRLVPASVARYWPESLIFAAVAAVALLLARNAPFWTDENWYFAGSWAVAHGSLPHRDFFFHHNPLVLYVFGLPQALWGPSLLLGRLEAWVFWFGAMAGVVVLAGRVGGRRSAWIALTLVATNVFAMRYFVTFDWRVLEASILVTMFWVAMRVGRTSVRYPLLAALLALNVTLRYPLDISSTLLVAAMAYVMSRPSISARTKTATIAAAACVLALVMLPVMSGGTGAVLFDTVIFPLRMNAYAQESGLLLQLGSPAGMLVWSVDLLRQMIERFAAVVLPFVVIVAWRLWTAAKAPRGGRLSALQSLGEWWWLAVLYVLGSEVMMIGSMSGTPVTRSGSFVVAILLVAVEGVRFYDTIRDTAARRMIQMAFAAFLAIALVLQDAPSIIRIRWAHADLRAIANAGRMVARNTAPGDSVLTLLPAVVTEAGRPIAMGMLMETYDIVPSWSDTESAKHRMVNGRMFVDAVETGRYPAVVLQRPGRLEDDRGRGLLLKPYREGFARALGREYVLRDVVAGPVEGGGPTTVELYVRR